MLHSGIVFIAGCSHSGSTLLELLLSGHTNCAGIGEAYQLLRPIDKLQAIFRMRPQRAVCACDKSIEDCEFWGDIYRDLISNNALTKDEKYAQFHLRAQNLLGPKQYVIDSSKSLEALQYVHGNSGPSLRVLHVLRDVRGYSTSLHSAIHRLGENQLAYVMRSQGIKGAIKLLGHSSFRNFRRWYQTNRAIDTYLQSHAISTIRVSYEELCFSPAHVISAICAFLELEYEPTMLALDSPTCHNLFGNRMKTQRGKRHRIRYDDNWLRDDSWLLPSLLCRRIMRYNRQIRST